VYWHANLSAFAGRHTLGCLLARVAGRSPLEYLDAEQRRRQQNVVVAMMQQAPETAQGVVDGFLNGVVLTGSPP
jgi:hypothetical protein